ncbi:MAG: T9SS type A sorting domain-containing protein [Rhodothermales bacterium]
MNSVFKSLLLNTNHRIIIQFCVFLTVLICHQSAYSQAGGFWEFPFDGTLNDAVRDFEFSASGDLYVVGDFTTAGGQEVNHIARWDGATWHALGSGVNDWVYSIAILGDEVYVGGRFNQAGNVNASHIARWNGAEWSAVGGGLSGWVFDLIIHDGELFAGGRFSRVSGQPFELGGIGRWDGQEWSSLTAGFDGVGIDGLGIDVLALASDSSFIYAGGSFRETQGQEVSGIARWDGMGWSSLGLGLDGTVRAIEMGLDNNLYVGGNFEKAGSVAATNVAVWKDSVWEALGDGVSNQVNAISFASGEFFAGGAFLIQEPGDLPQSIARWTGTDWNKLGAGLAESDVFALKERGNRLYIGGTFTEINGEESQGIALWNTGVPTSLVPKSERSRSAIEAAYPNPFIDEISITINVENTGQVRLAVFDMLGREVRVLEENILAQGSHTYNWQCRELPPGLYVTRLTTSTGNFIQLIMKQSS